MIVQNQVILFTDRRVECQLQPRVYTLMVLMLLGGGGGGKVVQTMPLGGGGGVMFNEFFSNHILNMPASSYAVVVGSGGPEWSSVAGGSNSSYGSGVATIRMVLAVVTHLQELGIKVLARDGGTFKWVVVVHSGRMQRVEQEQINQGNAGGSGGTHPSGILSRQAVVAVEQVLSGNKCYWDATHRGNGGSDCNRTALSSGMKCIYIGKHIVVRLQL